MKDYVPKKWRGKTNASGESACRLIVPERNEVVRRGKIGDDISVEE